MIPVCPKCDVGLFILHFKSIEVDYCERCRGVWLDAGEFEMLMQVTGAQATDPLAQFQHQTVAQASKSRHLCPRCDRPLEELLITSPTGSALTLDRCKHGHGLWFDADEIQQLLAMYPATSGAGKTVDFLNDIFGHKPTLQQEINQ
jgi:uncharacterized protein